MSLEKAIADLDDQIAALQRRRETFLDSRAQPWPKRTTLYAYCGERYYDLGVALGLEGEALRLFTHFDEIRLDVEVQHDGHVTILACAGQVLTTDAHVTTEGA